MHRFDVKTIKMLSYVPNHSKQANLQKYQITMNCIDLMSKTSNNAKLQKWSNYDEVHGFDVKTNKNVELRRKPFKTTQTFKSNQITMNCIDLMSNNAKLQKKLRKCMDLTSKRTKMFCYVGNHSKQRKTTKVIKLRWIASIWRQNDQKCLVTSQTIQNNSNLQKYSNYNELHRFDVKNIKQRKTTKVIKLRRSAWIWRQNEQKCFVTSETIQNNANLQKLSKYNELHRFDVKTKKMLSYVPNHSKHSKTTKVIKLRWIASIWRQNDQKCLVTSQTIQNNSNLQKYSNYNELHRFDVKNIKQRKTTKVIKLRWSAWIWRQNEQKCWVTSQTIQNNANLQK